MPSPTLLRSCIEAIAILRAQGKARLVIADGLLFLLASSSSFVDVLQEAPHGYRVLIRELGKQPLCHEGDVTHRNLQRRLHDRNVVPRRGGPNVRQLGGHHEEDRHTAHGESIVDPTGGGGVALGRQAQLAVTHRLQVIVRPCAQRVVVEEAAQLASSENGLSMPLRSSMNLRPNSRLLLVLARSTWHQEGELTEAAFAPGAPDLLAASSSSYALQPQTRSAG